MTQPAQTTTVTFEAKDFPKVADLAARMREEGLAAGEVPTDEATAADNMRRLWRQEVAVREAETALAHAKALAKDAKETLEEELAKLRGMVAEFSDPAQLA